MEFVPCNLRVFALIRDVMVLMIVGEDSNALCHVNAKLLVLIFNPKGNVVPSNNDVVFMVSSW